VEWIREHTDLKPANVLAKTATGINHFSPHFLSE